MDIRERSVTSEEKRRNRFNKINHNLVFAIIAIALLMNTIDSTIVATALHAMQHDLNTTVSWAGWTLTAYSFGFVIMLPLSAKLSTQFGHKNIYLLSVLLFTVASLFCGLSDNIYVLIVLRVFQAMGGAGITPAATGIIVEHFGKKRSQYLGLFGSFFATGTILGPIFGGMFVTYLSWHWIFFINIPLGILVLILSHWLIPDDVVKKKASESMDFKGLAFMGFAILTAMYAATYLANHKQAVFTPVFLSTAVISIIAFVVLFRHLRKVKQPFINPRFIFGKGFGAVNMFNIIFSGMGIGLNSLIPLYAINRYGFSDLHSGTLLVAGGIASVVLSTIMSIQINKTGYRVPLYIGSVIIGTSLFLLAIAPPFGVPTLWWLISVTFLGGIGFGIISPAGRNAGIQLAPEQSANIAAVRSLGMQLGQIFSIGAATAIISDAANAGMAQSWVFVGLGAVLFLSLIPVISHIPEIKGSW